MEDRELELMEQAESQKPWCGCRTHRADDEEHARQMAISPKKRDVKRNCRTDAERTRLAGEIDEGSDTYTRLFSSKARRAVASSTITAWAAT